MRTVILTIGETWPTGHILESVKSFPKSLPVNAVSDGTYNLGEVDLIMEGDKLVTYSDINIPEGYFVCPKVTAEVADDMVMKDAILTELFLALHNTN